MRNSRFSEEQIAVALWQTEAVKPDHQSASETQLDERRSSTTAYFPPTRSARRLPSVVQLTEK